MIKQQGKDVLVVDAHAHTWKHFDGMRFGDTKVHNLGYGKIRQGGEVLDLVPPAFTDNEAPVEILMGYMDNAGIDKAVILQNPCYGDQRDYVKEVMRRYPERIHAAIGKLDPRDRDAVRGEIDSFVRDYGFKGIKLEVPDVPFEMDDPAYDFMWKKITDENLIAVIDLGWGKGTYDFNIDRLTRVMEKFPQMRTCIAHLGVSRLWDLSQVNPYPELQKTLALFRINREHLYMDLSAMPFFDITEEHPDARCQDILKVTYETIGADRLMFGTDFPSILKLRTYNQCLDFLIHHCDFLSQAEKINILGQNALRAYA